MHRHVALASAFIALAFAPVLMPAAAAPACVPADLADFVSVNVEDTVPGRAPWRFATAERLDRLPATAVALAVNGGDACDLTAGYAAFFGTPARGAPDAELTDYAVSAAERVFIDVFPGLVVDAATPVTVNHAGAVPVVAFTAWTPRNGLVADFVVAVADPVDVRFTVRDVATGDFAGHPEGWLLLPGDTQERLEGAAEPSAPAAPGASTKRVLRGTNADGTGWRVTYYTDRYVNESEADRHGAMHLDGALAAYAVASSWGFSSPDPDGTMDVTLDGCACIYAGTNANIHMFPRANDLALLLPGLTYPTEADAARLILGHELFHHFQYGIQSWRFGDWMTEGMARYSETVHMPAETFHPDTLFFWPNDNGVNSFVKRTDRPLNSHTYDFALAWGYLAAANGGMAFIKAVLEESANGGTAAATDGVAAIDRALARFPDRTHADFATAWTAFTASLYAHDGFEWGDESGAVTRDWSTYLDRVTPVVVRASRVDTVDLWGIQFLDSSVSMPGAVQPRVAGTPLAGEGPSVGVIAAAQAATGANVYGRLLATDLEGNVTQDDLVPSAYRAGITDALVALVRGTTPLGPPNPATRADPSEYQAFVVTP